MMICFSVSYAEINGTRYVKQSMVFIAIDEEVPVFGKVKDIIVVHGLCFFVLVPYVGYNFCTHFNAYEVEHCSNQYIICKQEELIDHHLLTINKSFGASQKLYICLKYHVF